jgi:predicted glutamine amidotransferase
MRREEAFVQAVEEMKMEKPTTLERRCCVAHVRSASQQLL